MRVLVINNTFPSAQHPHAGAYMLGIEAAIQAAGHQVLGLYLNPDYPKLLAYLMFYFRLLLTLVRGDFDVCYAHHMTHYALLLRSFWLKDKVVCFHFHGTELMAPARWQKRALDRLMQRFLEATCIYASNYLAGMHRWKNPSLVSPSGGVVAPVGEGYKQESETLQIGFFARGKIKGSEEVAQLINSFPPNAYHWWLMESNDWPSNFNDRSDITFVPPCAPSEMPQRIAQVDVVLCPTHRDSLNLLALEAIAIGKPVLVPDAFEFPHYVHEANGRRFRLQDLDDLRTQFLEMTANINSFAPELPQAYSKTYVVEQYKTLWHE